VTASQRGNEPKIFDGAHAVVRKTGTSFLPAEIECESIRALHAAEEAADFTGRHHNNLVFKLNWERLLAAKGLFISWAYA